MTVLHAWQKLGRSSSCTGRESKNFRVGLSVGSLCKCLVRFGRRRWNLNLILVSRSEHGTHHQADWPRKFNGACSNGDVDRSSRKRAARADRQVRSSVTKGLGNQDTPSFSHTPRGPKSVVRDTSTPSTVALGVAKLRSQALCILARNSWVKTTESGSVTEERGASRTR